MKKPLFFLLVFAAVLVGCGPDSSAKPENGNLVGADRDEHGCIGSAGYQWCAKLGECVRPWELEKDAATAKAGDFAAYCDLP